jgi:formylglycine-generating enzyme required for sulfatase activity
MMRLLSAIALAIWSIWLSCQPAFAEKRVALVIGNSAYQRVPVLANPVRDADDMAEMFRNAGLTVITAKHDLSATDMRRALRDFADEVRDADVAIVYYAGHGMEIEGTNYLIPVDALLERDIDAFDEAIPLDRLLAVMEPAKKLRLVILDACRDNPFRKVMKNSVAARAIGRGLAKIEPNSPNTLVAFAAKAGSTATDGDDKNSPYTAALLRHLPRPGLDLRKAFGFVRDDVLKVTRNRQEPFIYGSLGGDDVALVPAPQQPPAPPPDPNANARDDYELAQQINVVSAWNAFIAKYPSGFYSDLAKAQRDKLIAAKAAVAEEARVAAEKKAQDEAKAAEAERARIAVQLKAAEDARIAAEQAKAAEDARAAAQKAKAAEDARLAAEKAKAAEDARIATAKAKAAEDARIAAEKAKAAEEARIAAEAAKAQEKAKEKAAEKAAADARAKAAAQAKTDQNKTDEKKTESKADEKTHVAAAVVGDNGDKERIREQPRLSPGCPGGSAQVAALPSGTARSLSQPEECGLKPRDVFKECENCPEMVVVPPGDVLMGSSPGDIDNGLAAANEGPQHKAIVKQAIAVGRFEVTRDQFAAFVKSSGYRPSDRCYTFEHNLPQERTERSFLNPGFVQGGNHPVVCISWTDAKAYVQWLSQTTGKPYRLLSEAEFEYVARAGNSSRFGVGDDPAELCKFANGADRAAKAAGLPANAAYMNCSDGYPFTAPVGSFAANAFGLYDMIGNVWEWTEDCFYGDYATASADSAARADATCTSRSVRGGDWFSSEASLRPAVRAKANVQAHHDDIGFRVVRTLVP